jgi:hypothetical protein
MAFGIAAALSATRRVPLFNPLLAGLAAGYLFFAFVCMEPWTNIPWFEDFDIPGMDDVRDAMSKQRLDPLRLMHILSAAYLVFTLVPAKASWLNSRAAGLFVAAGRHSLEIFCLGVLWSIIGNVMIEELGRGLSAQTVVTLLLVGFLLATGAWLEARRPSSATRSAPSSMRALVGGARPLGRRRAVGREMKSHHANGR